VASAHACLHQRCSSRRPPGQRSRGSSLAQLSALTECAAAPPGKAGAPPAAQSGSKPLQGTCCAIPCRPFAYDVAGRVVLVRSGWGRHWRTDAYVDGSPCLTADAAEHLVERGTPARPSRLAQRRRQGRLLPPGALDAAPRGHPICENLTALDALPTSGARFSAAPVKAHGMGTFPVRAYATIRPAP
jgi:hypothetical protein